MKSSIDDSAATPGLIRGMGLRTATALNMIDMIGVGPFITMPLMLGAMGGPQAMLGWIVGAIFAMCDGMVWAELGAAMPEAGGSYRYLNEIYGRDKLGRLVSFLFVWQLSFSAPLSIATGCLGFAGYAAYYWPHLQDVYASHQASLHVPGAGSLEMSWIATPGTLVAIGICLLTMFLLYRRITAIGGLSRLLWVGVMGTIGWIIFTGLTHFSAARAFDFPPGAFTLSGSFFTGLSGAMLIAAYDYWGYYNVCFLGAEVKDPERNIPRAVLLSIALVACLYIAMNICILAVVPWQELARTGDAGHGLYVVSLFMQRAYGAGCGQDRDRSGDVDGVRVGVFADAGLFAGSVRGCGGWKLFSRVRATASQVPDSARVVDRAGAGGVFVLLSAFERCDRGAGGDSHPAAVSGAGSWSNRAAGAAARHAAAISYVVVSAAGAAGRGWIFVCAV